MIQAKRATALLWSLGAMLIVVSLGATIQAQTIRIETRRKTGHAFITTKGTFSAMHVGGMKYDYVYPAMDVALQTSSKSDKGFKTSDLAPAYFVDRRGVRHRLVAIGTFGLETVVSLRFFPGESGMPIFANDGTACCVVLGNAFTNGSWRGRVSRITPILDAIARPPTEQAHPGVQAD